MGLLCGQDHLASGKGVEDWLNVWVLHLGPHRHLGLECDRGKELASI